MFRRLALATLLAFSSCSTWAQASGSNEARPNLTGHWTATVDYLGSRLYTGFDLDQQGEKLTGKLDGDPLEGSIAGSSFHFLVKGNDGGTQQVKGTVQSGALHGEVIETDPNPLAHSVTFTFIATLRPARPTAPARRYDFAPTVFYRQFSPFNQPVLTVNPGDTIHTTTVDAAGNDLDGVKRVLGGNPQTGPFYVESAMPGDMLVVRILRLRLNRDWALSDDDIVQRATDSDLTIKMKDGGKTVIWHLDLANGTASPAKPSPHLAHYTVPLRPMLGCIATAPPPTQAPPGTGDSGPYGGNMDFNEITEGATIYLPVSNPGALLYLGDAHAAQGDGELNGNALETSMDVEFSVDVLRDKWLPAPRVETSTSIIAMGLGSLDDALRQATSNMAQWLTADYQLTPSEIAQVLGTAAHYSASEVADRNAGMVLRLEKARLKTLTPAGK